MRPHNKSVLWNEYLEHPEKTKKYFNTKHKKAFCRRCISQATADLDRCPLARARFNNTGGADGFVEGWEQWKRREAFDRVEALSGRSSNMQRHIRTCEHIPPDERAHIMANFEATRHPPRVPSSPRGGGGDGLAHGGSESSSSSSFGSPDMGRQQRQRQHDLSPRSAGVQQSSPRLRSLAPRPEPEPSRKITLQSILNEESEPPRPYQPSGSSNSGNNTRREVLGLRGIGGSVGYELAPPRQSPPRPPPPSLPALLPLLPTVPTSEAASLGLVTASEVNSQILRVNQLNTQIQTFRNFRVSEDCAQTVAQLRVQLSTGMGRAMGGRMPAGGELMRRLDGVQEELSRVVEAYGRGAKTGDGWGRSRSEGGGEGGEDGARDTPRARSTSAWTPAVDSETDKRHPGGVYQ